MLPPCTNCILGNSCYQICSLTEKYFEENKTTLSKNLILLGKNKCIFCEKLLKDFKEYERLKICPNCNTIFILTWCIKFLLPGHRFLFSIDQRSKIISISKNWMSFYSDETAWNYPAFIRIHLE